MRLCAEQEHVARYNRTINSNHSRMKTLLLTCLAALSLLPGMAYAQQASGYPKPNAEMRNAVDALGSIRTIRADEEHRLYSHLWKEDGKVVETTDFVEFLCAAVYNTAIEDWACSPDGNIVALVKTFKSGGNGVVFYVYKRGKDSYEKVGEYNFIVRLGRVVPESLVLSPEGMLITASYSSKDGNIREFSFTRFISFWKKTFAFPSESQVFYMLAE